MAKLCVDIGNTIIKAGLFEQERMIGYWKTESPNEILNEIESSSVDLVVVSDVRKQGVPWLMQQFRNRLILLNSRTPLPFRNEYSTPETLGADRIALVAGAQSRFPGQNLLVLDAGTCLTYDFLDDQGVYRGGAISPGLQMRFRSLHDYTAALPMVEWKSGRNVELIGNSTENSILSGIVLGMKHEVAQTIVCYAQQFSKIKVVVTGGDLYLFEGLIKNDIFAVPNLLLEGLNQIAIHNENYLA
jgi:type III pantothenate kinase